VKGGHHIFGDCRRRHDYSPPFLPLFPVALMIVFFPASGSADRLLPGDLFMASNRHCIERDDYFDKAPCRLRVLPAQPLGIISSNVLLISFSKS
jgi:hypothetical protein